MSSVVYFMSKDSNASSLLDTSFLRILAFCCTNASSISSPCLAAASTLSKRLYGRQTALDFPLGRSSGGVTCDICVSELCVENYVGPITCRRFSIDQSKASDTHPHLSALPIHPSAFLSIPHCTSQEGMFHLCLLSLFSWKRVSATASLYLQLV